MDKDLLFSLLNLYICLFIYFTILGRFFFFTSFLTIAERPERLIVEINWENVFKHWELILIFF